MTTAVARRSVVSNMEDRSERPDAVGERGQLIVGFSLALAGLVISMLLLQGVVARTLDRARAQSAADAAALAGVAEDESVARAVAAANDSVVVSFEAGDNTVEVVVEGPDGARARARAERRLEGPISG